MNFVVLVIIVDVMTRDFVVEKKIKMMVIIHRAATAQLGAQNSNTLARTAFFLVALSPREFRRATEAGSSDMYKSHSLNYTNLSHTIYIFPSSWNST